MQHKQIRRVSIDKFYEMVTGDAEAFAKLCKVLPLVISEVVNELTEQLINNTVIEELKQKETENILQNLYLWH